MKIFSIGFILAFSICSWFQHIPLKTVKDFFEELIVIIPSLFIVSFVCYEGFKFIYNNKKHKKCGGSLNNNWQCLLVDGVWGSGKTTYYENNYQYIDAKPNIYISCFSASRSELIAQIIQQQFWCKLLTLNGVLAKFMESSWQIFMPKGRVIVFDDLERLHASHDNYLDLIGVIDYLKITNECQVILIADISKTQQIFNSYMERAVDEVLMVPKLQLMDLFSLEYNNKKYHNICTNIKSKSPIITESLNQCQKLHNNGKLNNLRIFKNVFLKLFNEVLEIQKKEQWDEKQQFIYTKAFAQEFKNIILKRYIFFIDNVLFKELCTSSVSAETEGLDDTSIGKRLNGRLNEEQKPSELDILKARKLNERLDKYTDELQASDFNYEDKELFNKKLSINTINAKLIEFVLYHPEQFIGINSNRYNPFEQRLFDISKDSQLNIAEWKNYIRDNFIPRIIDKLKIKNRSQTWVPEYYSSNYGAYLPCDFSSYYQMAIILTQVGIDDLIIDEIIECMVQCERHNRNFGDTAKNWIIDDNMNKSIKETFWNDKLYSLVWFLDYDVRYEINTIKDQVNQEIDKIFTEIQNKIKQKLNDGKH